MTREERLEVIRIVTQLRSLYKDHRFCVGEMGDLKPSDALHHALGVAVDAINEEVNEMYGKLIKITSDQFKRPV